MNARLKQSLQAAEATLPQAGQNRLALIVDTFTANYRQGSEAVFSARELEELQKIENEEFIEASSEKVSALFAKYGL